MVENTRTRGGLADAASFLCVYVCVVFLLWRSHSRPVKERRSLAIPERRVLVDAAPPSLSCSLYSHRRSLGTMEQIIRNIYLHCFSLRIRVLFFRLPRILVFEGK